jgi:Methylamine utilisation protein MauE
VELIGPYLVGCALLAWAGAMKAWRPDDTARALAPLVPSALRARVGVRQTRWIVRGVALVEAVLGVVGATLPRPVLAGCVAVSYVAFAAVVAYARGRGGALASCGCFGRPDTPATLLHVAVDLALAIAAAVVAVSASSDVTLRSVLSSQPLHGAPLVLLAGVGAWLTYLTLSMLATLHAAREAVGSPARRR